MEFLSGEIFEMFREVLYTIGVLVAVLVAKNVCLIIEKYIQNFETRKQIVLVDSAVMAAEKMFGSGNGEKKREFVEDFMKKEGYKDAELNRVLLEAVVFSCMDDQTFPRLAGSGFPSIGGDSVDS